MVVQVSAVVEDIDREVVAEAHVGGTLVIKRFQRLSHQVESAVRLLKVQTSVPVKRHFLNPFFQISGSFYLC